MQMIDYYSQDIKPEKRRNGTADQRKGRSV